MAGKDTGLGDWGRFFLRVVVGLGIMTHGYPKVFGVNDEGVRRIVGFTQGVADMGFPYPHYFAWAAALSEFVGGAMLVLGLGTRVAAFMIAGTMVVAMYKSRANGWDGMEKAALYLAPAVFFLLNGPGKKSLDALLFKRKGG
jgi:putative oxidoreductase